MDTKKIILYSKYFDMAEDLTYEQFGKVMWAIGSFFTKGDEELVKEFSAPEKMLYKTMKVEIEANFEKYKEMCEKRRKAGKISAQKRKEAEQLLTCVNNNKNINNKNNKNINKNMNNKKNNNNNTGDEIFTPIEISAEDEARLREKLAQIHQSAMD